MKERILLGIGVLAGALAGWLVVEATFVHFQVWVVVMIALPAALVIAGARRTSTFLWSSGCLVAVIQVDAIWANVRHKYYEAYGFEWTHALATLGLWAVTLGVAGAIGSAARHYWPSKAAS